MPVAVVARVVVVAGGCAEGVSSTAAESRMGAAPRSGAQQRAAAGDKLGVEDGLHVDARR